MLPQGFMQPHTKPCQGINVNENLTSRKAVSLFQQCWILSSSGTYITMGSALRTPASGILTNPEYEQLMF